MATTLGTINVVFEADVTKAVAGMSNVASKLDQTVQTAVQRSNQFATAISTNIGGAFDKAADKLHHFAESFSLVTTAIGAFSLHTFLEEIGKYDVSLENVRLITRQTTEEFKATRLAVLALAQSLQVSAVDTAEGFNEIVKSGFEAGDALKVLKASIEGARAGMTTAAITAKALVQTLNSFALKAGESETVIGKMVRSVDLSTFKFSELAHNIGEIAPLAAAMNVTLDETLGLFTALARKQSNLDEIATQIRSILTHLLEPTPKIRSEIEAILGGTIEMTLKAEGFSKVLYRLITSANGSSEALGKLFPNVRALSGLVKLTGEGFERFAHDVETLGTTGVGTLNRALDVQTKSFGNLVAQLKATAQNSLIEFFEKNRTSFISYTDAINKFIKDNPNFLGGLAQAAIALSALAVAIGVVKLAAGGLSIGLSVLSGSLGIVRTFFNGEAIASVTTFADRMGLLATRVGQLVGVQGTFNTVLTQASAARQAATVATNALAQAHENSRLATAAFNSALEASTAASTTATAASRAMTDARIAERVAEDALTAAVLRQEVAENRVAGLNLAASNRGANGRLKAVTPGAANLIPSAVRDLVSANNELAAAETALASATAAREAVVAKAASTTTIATTASRDLTAAASLTTVAQAEVATATTAATIAAEAESAAMVRLTAATGSAAAAEAALATATGAAAGTAVVATGTFTAMGAAIGAAVASIGALIATIATAVVAATAVAAVFLGIGYAIGKAIEKALEFFGLIESRSGQDVASDKLLKFAEAQKKSYAEANDEKFQQRMAENAKLATNVAEKLQNLADLARSANAGNAEAAAKLRELNAEFERTYGKNAAASIVDTLAGEYEQLANKVREATVEQAKAGNNVDGYVRIDEATGKVVATSANLRAVLRATYGESEGLKIADRLAEIESQMNSVVTASNKYANATLDLRSGNVKLRDIINETTKVVAAFDTELNKIAKDRQTSGQSPAQAKAKELADERVLLEAQLKNLELRRKATIDKDGGASSPEAANSIAVIDAQAAKIRQVLEDNQRQYTELYNDEVRKRRDASSKASDEIREGEAEALKAKGDLLGADRVRIEIDHNKAMRRIDDERDARIKAIREAIGLSDDERQIEIRNIEDQTRAELQSAETIRQSKITEAVRKQTEREADKVENRKIAQLKEAEELRSLARDAEKNHNLAVRDDLIKKYIAKLEEAGAYEKAQLVREQEANRLAANRLKLLQEEIADRVRAGQGSAGVLDAARSAESGIAGSSDVGTFRGAVRGKLSEFNSGGEARRFGDVVSQTQKTEYDALERQRREAINKGDLETARKIAQEQKEVATRFKILLDEIARRESELRKPAPPASQAGTVVRKPKSGKSYPTSPLYGGDNLPDLSTSPIYGGDEAPTGGPAPYGGSGSTPDDGSLSGLPDAINSLSNSAASLSGATTASAKASLGAIASTANKLKEAVAVLNEVTVRVNEIDAEVQRTRIITINAGP